LLGLHDAKITNNYEIMCMRGEGCNWVLRLTPKNSSPDQLFISTYFVDFHKVRLKFEPIIPHEYQ